MLKIAYAHNYAHHLPPGHRFPMVKYELLPEQLLHEGTVSENAFFKPDVASDELILRVHDADYFDRLKNLQLTRAEERKTGFPHNAALITRELTIMEGTHQCAEYALQFGVSMNIAGGTHHAYTDHGEGFCLLNDIAVAARYLLDSGKANQILVVDLDVHQGNGTAQIFKDESRVFTFSMHGSANYPLHKENSDLDIPLPDHTTDEIYLQHLKETLPKLIDNVQPDFIFFQSGVDILASDKLGCLACSVEGCKERDRFVLDLAYKNKIPLVASMGGGYSEDIKIIVEAHANTYRLAQEIYF